MSRVEVDLENNDSPPQDLGHPNVPAPQPDLKSRSKPKGCLRITGVVFLFTLVVLFYVVFVPLYLIYAGVAWLIFNRNVTEDKSSLSNLPEKKPFYQRVQEVQEATSRLAKLPYVIRSRLVIFMMIWLIVNLEEPELKNKFVLGTKLWKWTLLVSMISCGYYLIALVTRVLFYLLCSSQRFRKKKNLLYFVEGLMRSVNLVVLSGSVLLTWVLYFRTNNGIKKTDDTDMLLHVGTWSFVTLTIAAVLWVLKSVLLLKWEADAVFGRFSGRVMNAGFQVYFLGHICGSHLGIFQPKGKKYDHVNVEDQPTATDVAESTTDKKKGNTEEEREKAKEILCNDKNANLYDIKKMTKYFVNLSRASSREDDGSFDVLQQCRKINPNDYPNKTITVEELNKILEQKDANNLYSKLKDELKSDQISYKSFEKFMVNAQKNCVALGHTLLDAQEVVKVLNNVMTGLLIVIVFLVWLLLTDIATTKILVLIASPLLAATFVFGDTCKKIFEGIIFSFINHPFDVGDRCIIDKNELEVKRMSVLSTTFIVIGTKKEALYPNSALASIPIINLRGDPDPSDHVELTLDSKYSNSLLDELQNNINKIFEEDKGKKYEKTHTIIIKEIGDCVKMEIQYDHVMSIHETTHSQCLKKKRKQKSELLLQIKELIEEISKKTGLTTATISQEAN